MTNKDPKYKMNPKTRTTHELREIILKNQYSPEAEIAVQELIRRGVMPKRDYLGEWR